MAPLPRAKFHSPLFLSSLDSPSVARVFFTRFRLLRWYHSWLPAPGWGAGFFQLLIIVVVAGNVTISITATTAMMFPYVKKDLYRDLADKINVVGIPLCVIAGVVTLIVQMCLAYS